MSAFRCQRPRCSFVHSAPRRKSPSCRTSFGRKSARRATAPQLIHTCRSRLTVRLLDILTHRVKRSPTSHRAKETSTMATKSAASPAFAQLQDSVHNLQNRAEELLDRIRKEAGALVGKDTRRKLDHLLNQARAFPRDVQKRGAKTLKALEARASGAASEIRTQ